MTREVDVHDRFDVAVRAHGPALLRIAYQLTHQRSDAEDVVQAALLRVFRSVERRGALPDDLAAYLRRAVVNEFLRGRRRRVTTEIALADVPEAATTRDAGADHAQRDTVWLALADLPDRQRAALVLRHYEGLEDTTIAAVLSCRRSTVRSLCARGLAALRTVLSDTAEEARTP